MNIHISTEYAIQQVVLGLKALSKSESISQTERKTILAIAEKVSDAKDIADKIHYINIYKNKIDNIDKHSLYLGSWPHRATMIYNGEHIFFYDEIGGVIGEYFCKEAYENAVKEGRVQFMQ